MRRYLFYFISVVYAGFLLCWIYFTGCYWLGLLAGDPSRRFLRVFMPGAIGLWPSYLDYIRQMIKKGEFSIKLESWKKGRMVSYLIWSIIFSLQAYIDQDSLLFILAVICLVVGLV